MCLQHLNCSFMGEVTDLAPLSASLVAPRRVWATQSDRTGVAGIPSCHVLLPGCLLLLAARQMDTWTELDTRTPSPPRTTSCCAEAGGKAARSHSVAQMLLRLLTGGGGGLTGSKAQKRERPSAHPAQKKKTESAPAGTCSLVGDLLCACARPRAGRCTALLACRACGHVGKGARAEVTAQI